MCVPWPRLVSWAGPSVLCPFLPHPSHHATGRHRWASPAGHPGLWVSFHHGPRAEGAAFILKWTLFCPSFSCKYNRLPGLDDGLSKCIKPQTSYIKLTSFPRQGLCPVTQLCFRALGGNGIALPKKEKGSVVGRTWGPLEASAALWPCGPVAQAPSPARGPRWKEGVVEGTETESSRMCKWSHLESLGLG